MPKINNRLHTLSRKLIVLSLVVASASGVPAGAGQQFGVGIHNGQTPLAQSSIVSLGLSVRSDFQWRWVEQKPGELSLGPYAGLDSLFREDAKRGAHPLIVLCCAPTFHDDGDLPRSDAAIQAYLKYVKFIVDHFRGQVDQFEVWNEWNLDTGSKAQKKDWGKVPDYLKVLKAAYAVIKAEDPQATVIGGVVGGTDGTWMEKFLAAGGLQYLDGFSLHPYVHRHAHGHPDHRAFFGRAPPGSDAASTTADLGTPEEAIQWVDQLKSRMDEFAQGRKIPIYISEIGWPSSTSEYGIKEEVAAAYLARFLLMAAARTWIAGIWWYDLLDDGPEASNDEHRFGLLRQDQTRKPGYETFIRLTSLLRSTPKLTQSVGPHGEVVISGKYADGKELYAAWLPAEDVSTSIKSAEIASRLASGFRTIMGASSAALSATPVVLSK